MLLSWVDCYLESYTAFSPSSVPLLLTTYVSGFVLYSTLVYDFAMFLLLYREQSYCGPRIKRGKKLRCPRVRFWNRRKNRLKPRPHPPDWGDNLSKTDKVDYYLMLQSKLQDKFIRHGRWNYAHQYQHFCETNPEADDMLRSLFMPRSDFAFPALEDILLQVPSLSE